MTEQQENYEWQCSVDGPPWIVIDWQGHRHEFMTRRDGWDFIDRDKRMMAAATREAMGDVTDQITYGLQNQPGVESEDGKQAAHPVGEDQAPGAEVGGQGNRQARRRAGRAANRKADPR